MKTAAFLSLFLAAGTLHARAFVPSPTQDDPRARTGEVVKGGEVIIKAPQTSMTPPIRVQGSPDGATVEISLSRDFKDSPPENLVRGELEAANGEND